MTTAEKASTSELIRSVFGDNLWRTLDVGCGTGFPLDAGLVESVRYVGIDSSTAMLNCLVAKHPLLAGVHPMTFEQATVSKVFCGIRFDTVLALGGSASYLSPADIQELRDRSKRNVLLMHFRPGANSPTQDLDMPLATQSFRTATELARSQHEIGPFIASVL